jgi:hypothetical protein
MIIPGLCCRSVAGRLETSNSQRIVRSRSTDLVHYRLIALS